MELASASQDVLNSTSNLSADMFNFEARKVHDLKNCLNDLIYAQLKYHAKSLEILTAAHAILLEGNFDNDLEEVQEILDLKISETDTLVSPDEDSARTPKAA